MLSLYVSTTQCAGEPCMEHSDCPEACQTGLESPVCGPYLRSARLPTSTHPDHCQAQQDCSPEVAYFQYFDENLLFYILIIVLI